MKVVGRVLLACALPAIAAVVWLAMLHSVAGAKSAVTSSVPAAGRASVRQQSTPLSVSEVLTDTYEPNDSQGSARAIGLLPMGVACNAPTAFINATGGAPANFYKADGSTDIDFYRIELPGAANYTIQVRQNSPTLSMTIQLRLILPDGTSKSGSGTNFDLPFYTPRAGTLTLELRAANPAAIAPIQDYLYGVAGCSSVETLPTATPTNTPTPTSTPTPTPTSTPSAARPDGYEPNNSKEQAPFLGVGSSSTLNFVRYDPAGPHDVDWFRVFLQPGSVYQFTTSNLQAGVDTRLTVFATDGQTVIASNQRYLTGVRGAQVSFLATVLGAHFILIENIDGSPIAETSGATYVLQLSETVPGATATPVIGPTRTPFAGTADRFDIGIGSFGNGTFEDATLVAPDFQYDNLNFVPWNPNDVNAIDNDFFRLPVKQGVFYTCETLNLAPGVDTNIIIYNQDRVGIGGNDDVSSVDRASGKFASRFSWLSTYTGQVYVLVGEVNPPRASEAGGSNYSLVCRIGLPATLTPTVTPVPPVGSGPPALPTSQFTPTALPTARPIQNLVVRPIDRATPAPTPAPTPTPRVLTIDVQIFNDTNRNGVLDIGEGISDVSVRLTDEASGSPLGQASTDLGGRVRFSVQNEGAVRATVPLFGYSTLVTQLNASIRLGLVSEVELPQRLP